jgi:hypothetical protein
MNRFDLEDAISRMMDTDNEIDDIIYKVGDCAERPSEDDILNLLIGVKALNQARYNRVWSTFEQLVKNNVITDKNFEPQAS